MLPELFFFDAAEREVVAAVLALVSAEDRVALVASLDWLARLAALVLDCPVLTVHDLRQSSQSYDALIEHLGTVSDYDYALHVPTKAVVGEAYLVTKINFIKMLESAARAALAAPALLARLRFELGQSIYSRLAEELFISIAVDHDTPHGVRLRAGELLHRIWESRLLTEVDDFAPLLESAWEARNKVRPVLGTMLGTHEVFRLFQEARDERFLDYVSGDDVTDEQREAFEEFVFGLAYEEIARLRAHLSANHLVVVSADEAAGVLGRRAGDDVDGPEAVYASYKARKLNAAHRAQTGVHGPKHTAEEYVMLAFLSPPRQPL